MKRITGIFLVLILLFGLAACGAGSGQSDAGSSQGNENTAADAEKGEDTVTNIIVVYFPPPVPQNRLPDMRRIF